MGPAPEYPLYDARMERKAASLPRWLDGIAILAAFGLMLRWTWRTWPDPLVDFGRELYVPWQITMGHTLYRDIAYLNGPLSPYFNAAWMHVFGASLNTMVAANLVILMASLALVYALLNSVANRLAALTGTLMFVSLFGFGRLLENGNYNFVCPYSHEITHGVALSLAAIACLHLPRTLGVRNVAIAGLLTGLVFLTKVEVALACGLAVAVGFGLRVAGEPPQLRRRLAAVLFATTLTPGVVAFGLLCLRMTWREALKGTLGSLYWTMFSNLSSSPFYRELLGVDDLQGNLVQMFTGAALLSAAALIAVGIGFLVPRIIGTQHSQAAALIASLVTAGLGVLMMRSQHWFFSVPKALPFVMIVLLVGWFLAYRRESLRTERSHVLALRIALSLFALGLLAKMIFATRLYHYGFALAMPATLLLVAAFVSWVPRFAAARGADRGVVQAVGVSLAAIMVFVYLMAMSQVLRFEQYRVGSGSDVFLADGRGEAMRVALQWIDRTVPAEATLAVLPEGAMINFLSRRSNPTPQINLMPIEFMMFGEERVLSDFKNQPPDFVLLCHKDTTEYGLPLFGRDYGRSLARWVRENYEEVVLIGNRPLEDPDRFGMLLLRRRQGSFVGHAGLN